MRILILDDEPGLAEIMATSLRHHGYSAMAFTSPLEALKAIHESDVLVADYHLPGMTGLEMARQAHAQGWRGSLLLMSGHHTARSEGVGDPLVCMILDKPFSTQTLVEALPPSRSG